MSPNCTEFPTLREKHQVEKENIYEQLDENAKDEKLKRECLIKALNIEVQPGSSYNLPGAERKHCASNNDCTLIVVGKSIQPKSNYTVDHVDETEGSITLHVECKIEPENVEKVVISELVLEDVSDKDFLSHVIYPSPYKLKETRITNSPSIHKATVPLN